MSKEQFEEMPIDELEAFIKSGGEEAVLEEAKEEKIDEPDKEVIEDETEIQKEVEDDTGEEETEASVEKEESNPLLTKTPEELAKIIKDQQYYEARRGEELGGIRAELAALKQQKVEESISNLDEVEQENLTVVESALKHIRKKEALEQERLDAEQSATNFEQNRLAWDKLHKNEELSKAVSSGLDERFGNLGVTQEDRVREMSRNPDWVTNTMLEILGQKISSKERASTEAAEAKSTVAKRKAKASTNTGSTAKSKMTKSIEEMSFDEYDQYFKENFRKS